MLEDDNTLYDGFIGILIKIIGLGQTIYSSLS